MVPLEGYWVSAADSDSIVPCPNPDACQGNRDNLLQCLQQVCLPTAFVDLSLVHCPTHCCCDDCLALALQPACMYELREGTYRSHWACVTAQRLWSYFCCSLFPYVQVDLFYQPRSRLCVCRLHSAPCILSVHSVRTSTAHHSCSAFCVPNICVICCHCSCTLCTRMSQV